MQPEKKIKLQRHLIFSSVAALLALNFIIGARVYSDSVKSGRDRLSVYQSLELFSQVLNMVHREYVDADKVAYRDLIYSALRGMVGSLDPHSEFLTPEDFKDLRDDTEGSFGGLGLVVGIRDGFLTVIAPMENTPGARAGIMPGDRIIKIEGESTEKMTLQEAVHRLRGKPGTKVTITIQRPSTGMVRELTLTREEIEVELVRDINGKKEFPLIDKNVGYVRISQFGEKTARELKAAIQKLKDNGMRGMILDLRWNPGGLLDQAVEVASMFVPKGTVVVSTRGRTLLQNSVRRASGPGDLLVTQDGERMPLVVLVNLGSASASEIVAGCLQDLGRAVILGEKTFGKGSVQSVLPLPDGSALKLTTAYYYTPNKRCIHREGIVPDVVVPIDEDTERYLLLKRTPGGLDSLPENERVRAETVEDIQLSRAVDLVKGLLRYQERVVRANSG